MSEKDIFYLEKILPEPNMVFGFDYKSLEKIAPNCIFILDTNVLFVPFNSSEKNLSEIKDIFLRLKKEKKLFLPARVVREFANNRASRLGDLFLKIRQSKNNLNAGNFKIDDYPLLQNNSHFKELLDNYEKVVGLINASRKLLDEVESDILSWNWNDNVSKAYKEVFTSDIIIEVLKSEEELKKDLKFRIDHKIAPGYKDSSKLDDGIGDLIVWQTSLEIAKAHNKNLILVSNDQKNDWFYKQDREGLYPKYELFDEFRRYTNGKSMQIITFPKFLELRNATPETINEVKESIEKSQHIGFDILSKKELVEGMTIEHETIGIGVVSEITTSSITVDFKDRGMRQLLLKYAPLRIPNTKNNFLLRNPEFNDNPNDIRGLEIDFE